MSIPYYIPQNDIIMIPIAVMAFWLSRNSLRTQDNLFAAILIIASLTQLISYLFFKMGYDRYYLYCIYTVVELYFYLRILLTIGLVERTSITALIITLIASVTALGDDILLTRIECTVLIPAGMYAMVVITSVGSSIFNRLDFWVCTGILSYSLNAGSYDYSLNGMLIFTAFNILSLTFFTIGIFIRAWARYKLSFRRLLR